MKVASRAADNPSRPRRATYWTRFVGGALWAQIVLAAMAAATAPPQAGAPDRIDPLFLQHRWTIDEGLPVDALTDIAQTTDGWLWIGSFDGLLRFDGTRFTRFDTVTTPALRSNRIAQLLTETDGTLWILTEQGHLTRFADHRFEAVEAATGTPRGIRMAQDRRGTLWLASRDGLHRVQGRQLVAVPGELQEEPTQTIGIGAEDRIWVATKDKRLAVVDEAGTRWLPIRIEQPVQSLTEGEGGALWIGTQNGLFRWVDGATHAEPILDFASSRASQNPERHPEVTWEDHRMLHFSRMGPRGGLWESDGTTLRHNGRRVLALPPDAWPGIRAVTFDHRGSTWIATGSRGLYLLRPSRVAVLSEIEGLENRNVYPIYEDRQGQIWIGDAVGDLSLVRSAGDGSWSHEPITIEAPSSRNAALSIYDDPVTGDILIGASNGLYRVSDRRRVLWIHPRELPGHGAIRAIHRTGDGRLLLGTQNGLWSGLGSTGAEGHCFYRLPETEGRSIRTILEDDDGSVWLGTNGHGLMRWSDDGFRSLTATDGLSSHLIRALHLDESGALWVATEDRGLNRIVKRRARQPEITVIQKSDGLWDNSLHKILEDDSGWFWISTNRGVFRVLRSQLEDFADGRTGRVESVVYTKADGMRHHEANGGVQDAGFRARDGRLWFPTQRGVAIFDPATLVAAGGVPQVHVERLRSADVDLELDNHGVTLEAHLRSFEIAYTAIAFGSPERVRFRYLLEGFQKEWVEAGERRRAIFTEVPAGSYTFRVQARSADGVWNRDGARLAVVVQPFVRETWWFRSVLALLSIAVFIAGVRWRDRRQRARQVELQEQVARLKAECDGCRLTIALTQERDSAAQQAEKAAELERLKSELFADVSHELRTPLTLTVGPLRDLRDGTCGELPAQARDEVALASRNAERLLGYVDEILDTARMEAGRLELKIRPGDLASFLADLAINFEALAERHQVSFRFVPPPEPIPIWADPRQLYKVFSNLLSNAMRYTPAGGWVEMTVEDRAAAGTVVVAVRDEGPGISAENQQRIFDRFYRVPSPRGLHPDSGTGLGLPLARRLAELHGGSLTLDSAPGEGSVFRVELRLGCEHFPASQIVTNEPWPSEPLAGPELGEFSAEGATEPPSQRAPSGRSPADHTTVLVVDDHPGIRAFIRRHLEPGYRIEEAADGAEALIRARDLLPDLVISDIVMPEMDGHALCRALKEDPELCWVPVVLLTQKAETEDKLTGLAKGADDYITKPFDARELKARVDNLISSRRQLRERFSNGNGATCPRLPLAPGVRPTPDDREWLERVREAVEEGLGEDDFSVEALARGLAVHRGRLHQRLKQLTGESPVQLILRLRLERAAALLSTKTGSVAEVAYAVGYDSVSYFSRRFKAHYGKSPSHYQRGQAEQSDSP